MGGLSCVASAADERVGGFAKRPAPGVRDATHTVAREDVIAFFDRLADQVVQKTIVVLDNAPIHRGEPMQTRQVEWEKKGLHLLYLPPYSPEFNAIEILWKQAKYFWRRFLALPGDELQQEVKALMQGFGTDTQLIFSGYLSLRPARGSGLGTVRFVGARSSRPVRCAFIMTMRPVVINGLLPDSVFQRIQRKTLAAIHIGKERMVVRGIGFTHRTHPRAVAYTLGMS